MVGEGVQRGVTALVVVQARVQIADVVVVVHVQNAAVAVGVPYYPPFLHYYSHHYCCCSKEPGNGEERVVGKSGQSVLGMETDGGNGCVDVWETSRDNIDHDHDHGPSPGHGSHNIAKEGESDGEEMDYDAETTR